MFAYFRDFSRTATPHEYRAYNSSLNNSAGSDDTGTFIIGEDSISLSETLTRTRQGTFYKNGASQYQTWILRHGGTLSLHYAYGKGLISAFITPPHTDATSEAKEPILIWFGRNADSLTPRLAETLIRKFLTVCRVEGNYEGTRIERLKVRWWRFMDCRNREQTYNEYVPFFNNWEVPIITTALLLTNIALTILLS